ncbi:MAG TPA: HAD family hydrolase [Verrucomicrobiae bacterium]|jgi:histidinol-phosphate phosphatase family protein|nr:HAD family hydrolase [Verrucomicrobiae bacterium]
MAEKIIFIDRDGVINVDMMGDYVKSWEEFRFEKGAVEGLKKLCDAGYQIVLISNQAGIGDGAFPESALWDIQKKMLAELAKGGVAIKASYYCLHGKEAGCACRKPQIGLFEQAAREHVFDRGATYFIGDKATDVEAGKRFGLKTFFVRTGHGRADEPKLRGNLKPDQSADNLLEAAKALTA